MAMESELVRLFGLAANVYVFYKMAKYIRNQAKKDKEQIRQLEGAYESYVGHVPHRFPQDRNTLFTVLTSDGYIGRLKKALRGAALKGKHFDQKLYR